MLILKRLALSVALATAPFAIGLIASAARPQAESPARPGLPGTATENARFEHGPFEGAGLEPIKAGWFGPGPHFGPPGPPRLCRNGKALLNGYLAYLETKLSLTDAQKADWQSFSTAVRGAIEPLEEICKAPPPRPDLADPLETIKIREAPVLALAKSLTLFHTAAEKFVPVLTADQKREFSEALPGRVPPGPPFAPHFGDDRP